MVLVASHSVTVTQADLRHVVTVLPGGGYSAQGPVLAYPSTALHDAGWTVRTVVWEGRWRDFSEARQVYAEVIQAGVATAPGASHLVLGKSLGTLALPVANELGLPGVWLTPLLTNADAEDVRRSLASISRSIPTLIIGGTKDKLWDSAAITGVEADVIEFRDANHNLEVPGDWRRSIDILSQVTDAIETLARRVTAMRTGE
jgi:hypothetical protein